MPNDWDARGQPGRNDPAIRRAICGRLPACRAVGRCPKTAPVGLLLAAAVRSGGSKKSPRSSKLGRGRGLLSYRPPFFVLGQRRLFGWGRARAELGHHTVVADAKSILWPMCAFDAPPTQLRWPRRRAGGARKRTAGFCGASGSGVELGTRIAYRHLGIASPAQFKCSEQQGGQNYRNEHEGSCGDEPRHGARMGPTFRFHGSDYRRGAPHTAH
jgi:hypothetical protein